MTGLKKMTDYRKLRELVTSGTQLSSVTVLDLIDQALEAQEDAIHQTARAEQAEAQVRQVRESVKDAPTSDPCAGRSGPPDDWPDMDELIGKGEFHVAQKVRQALNGEAND